MKQTFTASIALFALLGCSTEPVKLVDFEVQPVKRHSSQSISMQEVQIDVQMAVRKAKWNVIPGETPGHITAVRAEGEATATVEIDYNLDTYSIKYKGSTSLDYKNNCPGKATNGTNKVEARCINPDYNEWVKELNTAIAQRLQY